MTLFGMAKASNRRQDIVQQLRNTRSRRRFIFDPTVQLPDDPVGLMPPKLKLRDVKSGTPEKSAGDLFDNSPLPGDRFASPSLNKIAKTVFKAPPGSQPVMFTVESFPETPVQTSNELEQEQVTEDSEPVRNLDISFESADGNGSTMSAEGETKAAPLSPSPTLSNSSSNVRSAEKPLFSVGDVVWAQTDLQFPFWPGFVVDASLLPEDLQQAFHFTSRNGKSSKLPIYFYGRNDYDVVTPARMKDFKKHRDGLKNQNITGSLYVVFRRGVRLADENVAKDPAARMEWMIKMRSEGASKEAAAALTRTGSTSSQSSRCSSRATSIQINTAESQDASASLGGAPGAAGGSLVLSPGSEVATPLSGLTIGSSIDSGRIPSRFSFPEYAMHTQTSGAAVSNATPLEPVLECPSSAASEVLALAGDSPETADSSFVQDDAPEASEAVEAVTAASEPEQQDQEPAVEDASPLPAVEALPPPTQLPSFRMPPLEKAYGAMGTDLGSDYEMVDVNMDPPETARSDVEHDADRDRLDSLAFSNVQSQQSSELFSQLEEEYDPFSGQSFESRGEVDSALSPPTWETGNNYIGAADADSPLREHTTPPRGSPRVTDVPAISPFSSPSKTESVRGSAGPSTPIVSAPASSAASLFDAPPTAADASSLFPTAPPAAVASFPPVPAPEPTPAPAPMKSLSDASSLFGSSSAPPPRPPLPSTVQPTRAAADASSLFGGASSDPFASAGPPPTAPPRERVTSGGRAAVVAAGGRGLFDNAPASADALFGAAPSGGNDFGPPAAVTRKVSGTKPAVAGAASDLFGSAPSDASPFGGFGSAPGFAAPPGASSNPFANPPPAAADLFGAPPPGASLFSAPPTVPPAASFFGAPPAKATATSGPPPHGANPFGNPPPSVGVFDRAPPPAVASAAMPASTGSPQRPGLSDAAALFGGSGPATSPARGDPFAFGAAPITAPVAPAQAAVPLPTASDAAALFGPPPTVMPPISAPVVVAAAPENVFAAPVPALEMPVSEVSATPAAEDGSYDIVSAASSTSNTAETSGECVSSPFGAHLGEASPFDALPTATRNEAASAADIFGAAPIPSPVQTLPPAGVSPPPTQPAAASRASTVDLGSSYCTSSAGIPQPDLRRNISSGPVFKGKAKLVSGASPFDAAAPTNTADQLFGAPAASAGDPFGSRAAAPAPASASLFGSAPAASDPFASAPNNAAAAAFATAPAAKSAAGPFGGGSNDLFSAPPPGAAPMGFGSPPSAVAGANAKSKTAKTNKANLSASDVFSGSAPVEKQAYAALVDPLAPPAPPGVKVTKPAAAPAAAPVSAYPANTGGASAAHAAFGMPAADALPSPVTTAPMSLSYPSGALPSPVPAGVPTSPFPAPDAAPASVASNSLKTKAPAPKGKKAPPPGMIATPHGYVPIASLQPGAAPAQAAAGNAQDNVGASASKPLVNHNVLTSLVTETKPEIVEPPPTVVTSVPSVVAGAPQPAEGRAAPAVGDSRGRRYVKPAAAVVAFGFGGRVVTMFPKIQHNSMPVFNPAYGVPTQPLPHSSGPTHTCGPVRVHSLIQLAQKEVQRQVYSGTAEANAEFHEFAKLLTLFPGPLTQSATADPSGTDATSILVRDALQSRIDRPVTSFVNTSKTVAGPDASEKLLWSLLKLCVDRGGVLSSDASDSTEGAQSGADALSPEVKIAQLLMGHAPSAAPVVPTGGAAVTVFSGSATSTLTSYAPDMTKSKELHGSFSPPAPATAMNPERYVEIEALLVVGRKEEALKKAIQCGEWSLALLIGSVCGADKYQEIIRGYSASHFPPSAPMHLLTLLFANQGTSAILSTSKSDDALSMWRHNLSAILSNKTSNWQQLASFLGYRLQAESKDIFAAHAAYLCAGAYPTFPSASSSGGSSHGLGLRHTGGSASAFSSNDSLHGHDTRTAAAELETQAGRLAGKYSLLGCDVSQAKHRAIMDCLSISALRGTEILEYTLHKRLAAQVAEVSMGKSPSADGIASFGKSLTDMFSWKGGASAGGNVPPKSPKPTGNASGDKAGASGADKPAPVVSNSLRYRVAKVKAVLCPLKVRFAMVLADFGLLKEAAAYALDAKNTVNEIGVSEDAKKRPSSPKNSAANSSGSSAAPPGGKPRSNSGSSANEWGVKPFNRNFVRALDEFLDRLGVADKSRGPSGPAGAPGASHKREGSTGSTSSTGNTGSLWGSMISSINLKDLVDGMTDAPAPTLAPPPTGLNRGASAGGPPPTAAAPAASALWPATPPPMPGTFSGGDKPAGGGMPSFPGGESASGAPAPPPRTAAPYQPTSYAPMSSMPPRPGNMAVPPATGNGGYPGMAMGNNNAGPFGSHVPAPAASNPESSGFFDVDLSQEQQGSSDFYGNAGSGYPPQPYPSHPSGPYGNAPSTHSAPYGSDASGSFSNAPTPSHMASGSTWNHSPVPPASTMPGARDSKPAPAAIPPSTSTSNFFGFSGSNAAPAPAQTSAPAPSPAAAPQPKPAPATSAAPPASSKPAAATAESDDGGKGLMGVMRKGLLKYLYPDAHDTSSNIGKSLDAVYNKETGRWEFPGEENSAPSPASLPPPTGPMGGMGGSGGNSGMNSLGVSPSPSMSAFGTPGAGPGHGGPGGPPMGMGGGAPPAADLDPMAALMAPPPRRMPSSYSTPSMADGDPLAALMAPPSMRYSMPPPSTAGGPPMPAINVWRPPVMPAAAPMPPAPVMEDNSGADSSAGGGDPSSLPPPPM